MYAGLVISDFHMKREEAKYIYIYIYIYIIIYISIYISPMYRVGVGYFLNFDDINICKYTFHY